MTVAALFDVMAVAGIGALLAAVLVAALTHKPR
jgi:hypothetical protein